MSIAASLELNAILEQVQKYCSFSRSAKAIAELQPSYEPLVIRRDIARAREALEAVVRFGPLPMGGIHDIEQMLKEARAGRVLQPQDLLQELQLIRGIKGILAYEKALEFEHNELKELFQSLTVHEQLARHLATVVNDYGEIQDQASPQLAGIRRSLRQADGAIGEAVNRFLAQHKDSVVDSIVTYRSGRAVILVKASEKNAFGGIVYGDSASGQASYVEPAGLLAANNRKQELLNAEQEEIRKILADCSQRISAVADEEEANLETCTLLDSIFARAEWGKDHDAVCAELSEERRLVLIKARHPLIDPKKVVANDYHLEEPRRMLLITGPNTGGKTVSLKIIGLFTLMTYCGMPVTAESAVIPYFDQVFVDIGDDQSVAASLSSFSASVEKLADVIRRATDRSLALLDEIGSGTDPKEGESLAIAILNELRQRHTMTVATTHYGRLKSYGKRHEDILTASVQFDRETLSPTYRYLEGFTGQSNALEVAEKYGMPKSITGYARFLLNQAKSEEDQLLEKLEQQLNENQQLQEKLEARLAAAEEEKKQLEQQEKQLQIRQEKFRDEAEAQTRQIVEEAQEKADAILKQMRSMQTHAQYHEVLEQRQQLQQILPQPEEKEDTGKAHRYQAGETVELRSTSQLAEVVSVNRRDLTIRLNGRTMRVHAADIRPTMRHLAHVRPTQEVSVHVAQPAAGMKTECNLIGMHVDEAVETLENYLSEAKVAHLKTFRVIHGDGTGALRKAVHQILARDSSVQEFRLGMPSEGGTGATVVTLKE